MARNFFNVAACLATLFKCTSLASGSAITVENGIYSRLTVQIEPQPQPENCVEFLNQLEVVLNETSYGLHQLSQHRSYIKDFQIILPKSWSVTACQPGRQVVTSQPSSPLHPDISILEANSFDGALADLPWAEQPEGCGRSGRGVKVPMNFFNLDLQDNSQFTNEIGRRNYQNTWELRLKAQALLKEWSKHRYGIFPEVGFDGDIQYPSFYKEGNATLASQGCAQRDPFCPLDQPYDRSAPTKQNLLCHGSSAIETILNHPDFWIDQPKPLFESVEVETTSTTSTTSSSLQAGEDEDVTPTYFPVSSLEATEKIDSPTLSRKKRQQNSTEPYLSAPQHPPKPQINLSLPAKSARDPVFNYVVPRTSRYVLVLDRTSSMGLNNRWTTIQRALYRFVTYLPVGAELSIITFGKSADVNLPPTVVTDTNREGLHGRIPRKVLENENNACVHCAINASFVALQNFMGQIETGSVLLVTGSPDRIFNVETILQTIEKVPVQIFPILFPASAHPDILSVSKYGKAYSVPEGEAEVSPTDFLVEILLDIFRESEGMRIQKVHEARVKSNEFAGTFVMEPDMLHKMSVTLSVDDENKVELFEITNPSGRKHLFSQFEDGMVVFRHPGIAQTGIWTYYAKLYANTVLPPGDTMTIDVVTSANSEEAEPFLLEVFTSHQVVDVYNNKVIVYAKVTKGAFPVSDANVVANIYRPGRKNSSGLVVLSLRDNGLGDPDVAAGDGIYSGYFGEFAAVGGYYTVQVSADDNKGLAKTPKFQPDKNRRKSNSHLTSDDVFDCCGKEFYGGETIPASPFTRQAVGPTIYVKQGVSDKTDLAPPNRILDLRMKSVTEDSLYVTLEWSAPGDNYDRGRATSYEIRCYTSRDALTEERFSEMGILVHSSFTPTPLDYGQQQTCTVGVPWPNEIFYYAIVAFDEAGNRSPISNIISVYIYEAPTTSTTSTSATVARFNLDGSQNEAYLQLSNAVSFSADGVIVNESIMRDNANHNKVYIATGVVCGLLILIIAVIVIILVRVRTKRSQYNADTRDAYRAYEPTPQAGGSKNSAGSAKSTNPNANGNGGHHNDMSAASKNLSSWLDSLPRSEIGGQSPNTTSHDISMNNSGDLGGGTLNRRSSSNTHTLTKTNPYRHKVLTNGSFLNLNIKESPPGIAPSSGSGVVSSSGVSSGGSDNGSNSSRPTTSTEDNSSESESCNNNKALSPINTASVISLRRSNTTLPSQRHFSADDTVLPPPDAFGNTASHGPAGPRAKASYSTLGRYPIDTSTAKAIIDTYSGNLFSRSSNYFSFRDRERQDLVGQSTSTLVSPSRPPKTSYATVMDVDSLEVYPAAVFSPGTSAYKAGVDAWDHGGRTHFNRKTIRTESVV